MKERRERYSLATAYLLLACSCLGFSGLHRFYLRKYGTGFLWMVTWGMGFVGTLVDAVRLPQMVREANLRLEYREALLGDTPAARLVAPARRAESVEHAILRAARRNKGPVSPSEIALEADISIGEAKKHLDELVEKGYAELRVRRSGQLAYVIPDFWVEDANKDFEDF